MPAIHVDRAAVIATAILQLADLPDDLRAPIESLLRNEIAEVQREAVADRGDLPQSWNDPDA